MNAHERIFAALNGDPVDRPPVFPQIGDHAGIINGLPYSKMYDDAQVAANAHLKALDLYGYDITTIQVEPSWPVSEACGAEVRYPPDKNPWITKYPIESENDLDMLELPNFMETRSSRVMIEGTRMLASKADVPIAAFMTGPITFSFQLMPYETSIKTMIKDPNFMHRLVKMSSRIILEYIRALKDAGASILVCCEHDYQMLKPEQVKEFSLAYLPEIFTMFDNNILHMCGKVTPHLEYLSEYIKQIKDLDMISIGPFVSIEKTQEIVGHKIGVAGNIDHLKLLPNGNPNEIKEAVYNAISENHNNPRFMVAPGCEITADTPIENVKAFTNSVKSYFS